MFVLNSEITIGSFKFSGVNEVKISRSIHSCVDTASVKIPARANVLQKDGRNSEQVVTATRFRIGDPVSIKLGYDGKLNEEFKGFVKELGQYTPLEIECEGYSYPLKNKKVSGAWSKIKLKDLFTEIVSGTGVKISIDDYSNIELYNIRADDKTGFQMIDVALSATNKAFEAWFIKPDELRVGLVYVPEGDELKNVLKQPQVKYRLGYNALQDNDLKLKAPTDLKVVIKTAENKRDRNTASATEKAIRKYILNHVSSSSLKKLEESLQLKESYKGYEGKLTAFLQPLCQPGYTAFITDSLHKDRDGDYLVESVEVSFGVNGARRIIEVGPKLSTK